MVWNNSEQDLCSWPYYLRDRAGFDEVYDASQSGAGSNHIFNSIVNEVETNPDVSAQKTLIVVMWSNLTRTDVIAPNSVTRPWHHMSNYDFDENFSTLSIFNTTSGSSILDKLCADYKKIIPFTAQVYESVLKILALYSYLQNKNFNFIFTTWQDPSPELDILKHKDLKKKVLNLLSPIELLLPHASRFNMIGPCGHPTPDGYLSWTMNCLIPYLCDQGTLVSNGS